MKISTKGLYGTLAIMDLAMHYATGHVHKADIAERQGIPEQYLAQLLAALRRAGFVRSVRGPAGGHTLARHPRDITVGDVVELLDGPLVTGRATSSADSTSRTVTLNLLRQADDAAARVLNDVTFDVLVARWQEAEGSMDFVI